MAENLYRNVISYWLQKAVSISPEDFNELKRAKLDYEVSSFFVDKNTIKKKLI
jgi:hypothetical protein